MISPKLRTSRISEDLADIVYFLLSRGAVNPDHLEGLERVMEYYVSGGAEVLAWMLSALDFDKLRYALNMAQMFQEYLDRMKEHMKV